MIAVALILVLWMIPISSGGKSDSIELITP